MVAIKMVAINLEKTGETTKTSNKYLLDQFWTLVSLDEEVRIQSIKNILCELRKCEQHDIDYTVQRLVKGLSSSRKAARQGYATALTHVIVDFEKVNFETVWDLMETHLTVKGGFKAQEERDVYFGMVFGLLTFHQATNINGKQGDVKCQKKIIAKLIVLMNKKAYLREVCTKALCDVLSKVRHGHFHRDIEESLSPMLQAGWEKCTPEDLVIALTTRSLYKKQLDKTYFAEAWERNSIVHKDTFSKLAKVLLETTVTSHPRVHIVWDMVLDALLPSSSFKKFWKIVVEDGLMQSSHERKFLAMQLLLKVAPNISKEQVPIVFSGTILRCIINSRQSADNYLYKAVFDVLSKLPSCVSQNADENIVVCLIQEFQGRHGNICFDGLTKTKVVEELACKLQKSIGTYISWLHTSFVTGSTQADADDEILTEKDLSICRSWVVNQLSVMLRSNKSSMRDEDLLTISTFLFLYGHFQVVKDSKKDSMLRAPRQPLNESTQTLCQQRFKTVLTELSRCHSNTGKTSMGGLTSQGKFFATEILLYAQGLLNSQKYVVHITAWTPEIYSLFERTVNLVKAINEEGDDNSNAIKTKGIEMLFTHTALQLFTNQTEAVDTLAELHTCYSKAQERTKRKKKEPHWTEVLLEILLNFLSQPSNLMRVVVDAVFPTILPHLTKTAFDLMIDAIKPKSGDEKEMLISEDDENEEEESSGDNQSSEDEDSECMSTSSEDGSSEEDDVDEKLKLELQSALSGCAGKEDAENDEDIDMDTCDPNVLQVMDEALASVFRARQQKQKEKHEKKMIKTTITHFKLRVLDLIEIFIKKQPKDGKIIQLLDPLLRVVKATHGRSDEQILFERTLGLFKNRLCQLHEYPSAVDLDVDETHSLIERFLLQAEKSAGSALHVTYITRAVVYLIRVLRGSCEHAGDSQVKAGNDLRHVGCLDEEKVVGYFRKALDHFMTKRSSHLHSVLFVEFIRRFPTLGWQLSQHIPVYLNTGCNNFRKVKACEMLKLVLLKTTDDVTLRRLTTTLVPNLTLVFESSSAKACTLKSRQFHDVVQLTDIFLKCVTKSCQCDFDFVSLRSSLVAAMESEIVTRSPSLLVYCKKVDKSLEKVIEATMEKLKTKNDVIEID